LGEFSTSETLPGVITLKNTCEDAVTVVSAKASCGCTTADFKRNTVLQPGETVDVTIRLRGGPTARVLNKTVTFTVEGYPQLKVPVRGTSVSFVTMTPDRLGQDDNPGGKIVLESIDGEPFKIVNVQPPILRNTPLEAAARHEVEINWDSFWNEANNAKVTFFFDHPKCNQHYFLVKLNPEQRAEINRRIREKGQKGQPAKGDNGKALNQPQNQGPNTLKVLVKQGRTQEVLKRIKDNNLDVNYKDKSGMSILGMASKEGNVEMMTALIDAGADVDGSDQVGRTPLMHAGTSKNDDAVLLLIDAGADVNAQDTFIGGPLAWTSGFGNAESVQYLVDAGARVETVGAATGFTPLIWASGFGDSDSIAILVEAGANVEAQDSVDGGTPLMHASRTGKLEGVQSLVAAGVNVNARDRNGKTALLTAAGHSNGSKEKILVLIEGGSDLSAKDNSGRNALDLARSRTDAGASEVIVLLEERMPKE
jgi:ankyrin repeat protein